MTGPAMPQEDPILGKARQLRQAGASIDEIKSYLHAKGYDTSDEHEGPGVFSRAMSNLGAGVSHFLEHPLDTIGSVIGTTLSAPVESAVNIVAPSVAGAERYNADPMAQARSIARFGGELHAQGVTGKQRAAGAVQTLANVATPGAFGAIKGALVPKVGNALATAAGLSATGAATGAAYNPDDPGAGAIAGGIATPLVGAAVAPIVKGVGKAAELKGIANRLRKAPSLGASAHVIDANIENATRENYGKADLEGIAAGGTSPGLAKALEHPRVKKYVDMVRGEEGSSMSDADVARKVYTLMSKQRRGLKSAMEVNGYDAAKDLEAGRLGDAMKLLKDATAAVSERPPVTLDVPAETFETNPTVERGREAMRGPIGDAPLRANTTPPENPTLRQALRDFPESSQPTAMQGPGGPAFQLAGKPDRVTPGVRVETPAMRVQTAPAEEVPPVMPSFPHAVSEKARMEGERTAFNRAADAAHRILRNQPVSGKRLLTQSPEAFSRSLAQMSPGELQKTLMALRGRGKEAVHVSLNPKTGFGVGRSAIRLNRLAPFLAETERRAGETPVPQFQVDDVLKLLGIPVGSTVNP